MKLKMYFPYHGLKIGSELILFPKSKIKLSRRDPGWLVFSLSLILFSFQISIGNIMNQLSKNYQLIRSNVCI